MTRLPHNVFMQMKYKISDYNRLVALRELILSGKTSPSPIYSGKKGIKRDPTAGAALRLVKIDREINALEDIRKGIKKRLPRLGNDFDPFEAFLSLNYFEKRVGPGKRRQWEKFRKGMAAYLAAYYGLI